MADSPDTSQAFADTMLRLLQTGKQVVIDGVGRLSRVHRPARVEVKDDGTRVLLPPSAVVDFTQGVFPAESSSDIVLEELKTSAGVDAAADWMKALVSLRSSLDRGESAELPGIGQFSSKGSDITFEATETLTRSVNAAFAGLVPIGSWATPEPEVERTDDGTAEPEPVDEIEIDFSKPESDETDDTLNEPEEETQPSTEAVKLVSLAELSKKLELDEEKQADEAETGSVPWEFKDSSDADEETDSAFDEADKGGVLEPEALSDDESETEHDDVLDHEVDEEAEDTFEEDDDLEEIIAGVWTAGEAAESSDALGVETEQEPDEAEFAVVGADVAAGATLASTLTPLSDKELTDAQKPEPEFVPVDPQPESEQSRWPLVLIPVALLLAVAAVVIFWPRLVGNLTSEQAAIGSLSPDTAAHAGGLTDSTALNEGGGESSADDATEPSERPQQPAQEATPPAAQANNSLRGSAPVNPAQGGFTWVVGSGNEQSAARLVERYRSQGFRASVLQGEANGLTVYRIALGQFTSRTEANRFRSQLPADAPAESWILSLGTP